MMKNICTYNISKEDAAAIGRETGGGGGGLVEDSDWCM